MRSLRSVIVCVCAFVCVQYIWFEFCVSIYTAQTPRASVANTQYTPHHHRHHHHRTYTIKWMMTLQQIQIQWFSPALFGPVDDNRMEHSLCACVFGRCTKWLIHFIRGDGAQLLCAQTPRERMHLHLSVWVSAIARAACAKANVASCVCGSGLGGANIHRINNNNIRLRTHLFTTKFHYINGEVGDTFARTKHQTNGAERERERGGDLSMQYVMSHSIQFNFHSNHSQYSTRLVDNERMNTF